MLFIDFDWVRKINEFQNDFNLSILYESSGKVILNCISLFCSGREILDRYTLEYYEIFYSSLLREKCLSNKEYFIKVYDSDTGKVTRTNILKFIELVKENKFENIKYMENRYELVIENTIVINKPKTLYKTKHFYLYISENRKNLFIWFDDNTLYCYKNYNMNVSFHVKNLNCNYYVQTGDIIVSGIKVYGNQFKFTSLNDNEIKYINFKYCPFCEKMSDNVSKDKFLTWIKVGKFDFFQN